MRNLCYFNGTNFRNNVANHKNIHRCKALYIFSFKRVSINNKILQLYRNLTQIYLIILLYITIFCLCCCAQKANLYLADFFRI